MSLLQLLSRDRAAHRAASRLSAATTQSGLSPQRQRAAIEEAERVDRQQPDHFGLTFALGRAYERLASTVDWADRAAWIERALQRYEQAVRLAQHGKVGGVAAVAAVHDAAWEPALDERERAVLAASFQAGVLLSAEFRVRDPAAGIEYLSRVTRAVQGYHPAWYYLGEAYLLSDQFDRAEAVWREALRRAPGDPALQSVLRNLPADRVHSAAKRGDWPRVLREIERLPDGAVPLGERLIVEGDAHLAMGEPVAAQRSWTMALAADPGAVGVRSRLRKLARRQERSATEGRTSESDTVE
ncbi:MAG TPA: tetratricopeptide repeat protein [Chloroflexota bacterium]|nr:tetratricopeptide repeat protein [Chloroflexota bacterium]